VALSKAYTYYQLGELSEASNAGVGTCVQAHLLLVTVQRREARERRDREREREKRLHFLCARYPIRWAI